MSTYTYNSNFTAILTSISTSDPQYNAGVFTIPSTVVFNSNTYNVTTVGDGTNSVATTLTDSFSVSFPTPSPSGSTISAHAFDGCTFLIGLSVDPTITI